MKRKLTLFLTTLVVSLFAFGIVAFAGTSFSSATYISNNSTTSVTTTSSALSQYYYFRLNTSASVEIYTDSSNFDTYGNWYNSSNTNISYNDDGNGNSNFRIEETLSPGTYYIEVTGYDSTEYGSCKLHLDVYPSGGSYGEYDISYADVSLSSYSFNYTGNEITPSVTVSYYGNTLTEGYDYYLEYDNNINAGTATVYVIGIGDYYSSSYADYTINKVDLSYSSIALSATSYTYNGSAKTPGTTVKRYNNTYVKNTDYKVTYSSNKNAGTAYVTITGINNCYGSKKVSFKINPKKVTSCALRNQSYTGKKRIPAVHYNKTVKEYCYDCEEYHTYTEDAVFKKGTDYTMTISGGYTKIGTYTATIKFKGNYTGTLKRKFKIIPAAPKNVKTTKRTTKDISISWSKVKGAQGYKVYRWKSGKGYVFYKSTTKTSMTVPRASKNDIDVYYYVIAYKKVGKTNYNSAGTYNWNYLKPSKISFTIKRTDFGEWTTTFPAVSYYEYQVSTDKNFKNKKTWKFYGDQCRSYNFVSGKKYYVRARRYIYNKSDNLEVGPWSDTKTVTPY